MNINENILHQVAARFIKGENIEVDIKGSEIQIETLHKLLTVSKNLMLELNKKNNNIDSIINMLHEKKELTRKFQNISGITWKL